MGYIGLVIGVTSTDWCKAALSKYLSTVWSISQFYIPSNISSVAESSINFSNPTLTSQIFQQRIKLVIDGISEWRDGLSHSWKHLTFSSTIPILHQVTPVSQSSEMIIGVACQNVVRSLSLSGHEDEISKSGLGSALAVWESHGWWVGTEYNKWLQPG